MSEHDLPLAAAFTFEVAEGGEYLRVTFHHEDASPWAVLIPAASTDTLVGGLIRARAEADASRAQTGAGDPPGTVTAPVPFLPENHEVAYDQLQRRVLLRLRLPPGYWMPFRMDERFADQMARAIGSALAEARAHRGPRQ